MLPEVEILTLDYDALIRIQRYDWGANVYSPDEYAKIRAEEHLWNFKPIEKPEWLTFDESRRVGLGEAPCPRCGWVKGVYGHRTIPLLHRGAVTGIELYIMKPCVCRFSQLLWERWSGDLRMVPTRYEDVRMGKLEPSPRSMLSLKDQAFYIKEIQEHPDHSYMLCGGTGTGKTTYMTALFASGLCDWAKWAYNRSMPPEGAWLIDTNALLDQHMDWRRRYSLYEASDTMEEPKPPTITKEKIKKCCKAGYRPRVFLDEFDKVSWTPARLAVLFEILDTVYAANGQLVISSNVSRKQLEAVLGKCLGPAVLRRVNESQGIATDGTVVEALMFDFFQPGSEAPTSQSAPATVSRANVEAPPTTPAATTDDGWPVRDTTTKSATTGANTGKPRSKGAITNPAAQRNAPRKPTMQP